MTYDEYFCSLPKAEQDRIGEEMHATDRAMLARYEGKVAAATTALRSAERRHRTRKVDELRRQLVLCTEVRDGLVEAVRQHDPANWDLDLEDAIADL